MPKEISHILFAQSLPMGNYINNDNYLYGALSPDLFYYDMAFFRNTAEDLSFELHAGKMDHIRELLVRAKKNKDEDLFAFLCGYMSHAALDISYHPLINSLSGDYSDPDPQRRRDARREHRKIESALDLHLLGDSPANFHFPSPDLRILHHYLDALRTEPDLARILYKKHKLFWNLFRGRVLAWVYQNLLPDHDITTAFYANSRAEEFLEHEDVRSGFLHEKATEIAMMYMKLIGDYRDGKTDMIFIHNVPIG